MCFYFRLLVTVSGDVFFSSLGQIFFNVTKAKSLQNGLMDRREVLDSRRRGGWEIARFEWRSVHFFSSPKYE